MSHEIVHSPTDPGSDTAAGTHRSGIRPVRSYGPAARAAAEGCGSFIVVLAGLGVTLLNTQAGVPPTLAFGFALLAAMIAFGYISGGHFNPAVTLGFAAAGRTPWGSVLPYIAAQLIGGAAAAGLLWLLLSANAQLTDVKGLFESAANGFDEHSVAAFPLTSAFLAEVVTTAILVAVFLGATARHANRATAPFAVGLTYAALLTLLLPVTNGSLNPARSTAAALFTGDWALAQLWLFFAAPLVGAMIAGLIFRSIDSASGSAAAAATAGDVKDVKDVKDAEEAKDAGAADPVGATEGAAGGSPARAAADAVPAPVTGEATGTADDARSFFDKGPGTPGRP
jgi:aquaporin Z